MGEHPEEIQTAAQEAQHRNQQEQTIRIVRADARICREQMLKQRT